MNVTDHENSTDKDLLARFRATHDEAAFTLLVRRYGSLVLTTARQIVWDEHRAEDVYQAVFMVLARDAQRIRNSTNVAGWLYGVTYRIATRIAKKQRNERDLSQTPSVSETDALTDLITRIERDKVLEELHRLPEKYSAVLILKYYREMTVGEVAEALGLSTDAVAGRLKRGRNELRMRLARQGIGLLVFAAVVESMTSKAVASERIKQTVDACLLLKSSVSEPFADPINQLALQESTSMFTRSVLRNAAVTAMLVCVITLGVTSWPSAPRFARAQDRPPVVLDAVAATSTTSPTTTASSLQVAATSPSNEQRIASALREKVDLEFDDQPLSEVVARIADIHEFTVVIDEPGLAAEGVTPDTPISLHVNGIRLENALKLMLRPHRLAAVVSEEVLLVTGKKLADEYTTSTKIYPFNSNLLKADELAGLVQSKIEPSSWDEVGGQGSVDAITGAIVVRNAARVHDEVAEFLMQLQPYSESKQSP